MNLRDECTSELNFFGDNQYLVVQTDTIVADV